MVEMHIEIKIMHNKYLFFGYSFEKPTPGHPCTYIRIKPGEKDEK